MLVDETSNTGVILKEMRIGKKLTVRGLAKKIGCSHQHIYDIEKCEASPTIKIVSRWVEATQPSLTEILKLMIPQNYLEYLSREDGK